MERTVLRPLQEDLRSAKPLYPDKACDFVLDAL